MAQRFVNSLFNGTVLSKTSSTSGGFKYVTYKVRLSPRTETGMYDMNTETPTRTASTGFVLPSNNEWVKAAYYDPKHGGTDSYWVYPTGPFNPPHPSKLNPTTGDVVNAGTQPLATYNPNDPNSSVDTPGSPAGAAPDWCPSQAGSNCNKLPIDFPPGLDLEKNFMGNVSTVGQAKTPSPWGAYDMGGNVVEHTDSLAPRPRLPLHPGLALLPRRCRECAGIPGRDLWIWLLPGRSPTRQGLSLDGLPRGRDRRPQVDSGAKAIILRIHRLHTA